MTEADDLTIVRPSVQQHESAVDRMSETPTQIHPRRWVGGLLGFAALAFFVGALGFGGWRSYSQQREVAATAEEQRDFIPKVRVATVQASDPIMLVALPATTSAFASANIFARATGYIDKDWPAEYFASLARDLAVRGIVGALADAEEEEGLRGVDRGREGSGGGGAAGGDGDRAELEALERGGRRFRRCGHHEEEAEAERPPLHWRILNAGSPSRL